MNRKLKKKIAFFEIFLVVSLSFAFSYFINESSVAFGEGKKSPLKDFISFIGKMIFSEKNLVSAYYVSSSQISDIEKGVFTCLKSKDGSICQEYTASECSEKCADACVPSESKNVAECKRGTCYDSRTGICQEGSTQASCTSQKGIWYDDSYGNVPPCKKGCCIIGGQADFVTERACAYRAEMLGMKREFKANIINRYECMALGLKQEEGACVFESDFEKTCKFTTKTECTNLKGVFYREFLCSNPLLNTTCEPQKTTACFSSKDGNEKLYWVDSCGNKENIFSIPKSKSWNNGKVLPENESCSVAENGNLVANVKTCGNCNYLLGTRCGKATEKEKASVGDFVCRDLSCIDENGNKRFNGETWCVYQGAVGVEKNRGTDTPGSRHFRRVCINGEIRTEPCADYRNEICVESKTKVEGGKTFSSAACVINRWQECINYNNPDNKEEMIEKCSKNEDCFVKEVYVSSKFNFKVCAPKYPPGFQLNEEGRGEGAEMICSMATLNCTYVKVKELFGSKEINKECITEKFAEQMNDFCISLGDCGGKVNYEGEYSENYKVQRSDGGIIKASQRYLNELARYSEVIKGKVAEPPTNMANGLPGFLDTPQAPGDPTAKTVASLSLISGGLGLVWTGLSLVAPSAAGTIAGGIFSGTGMEVITSSLGETFILKGAGPNMGIYSAAKAFSGVLLGAAAGFALTSFLIKITGVGRGLPPAVAYGLMAAGAVGGAMVGYALMTKGLAFSSIASGGGLIGIVVVIVVVIIILVLSLFGIGKVKKIEVSFKCKPWQPPAGGANCEKCGKDGLPCSPYACQSLGQTCQLINEGTAEEKCINIAKNDTTPPIISPWNSVISEGHQYKDVSERGFKIAGPEGCIKPYTKLIFGISLNEPGQCKYSTTHTNSYDEMENDFGLSSLYRTNHTMLIPIPDLVALGLNGYDPNLTSEYNLFVRCKDKTGNKNTQEYVINFCIKQGDDLTPPIIERQEPELGTVGYGVESVNVTLYTNEPATCKLDNVDTSYELMKTEMSCVNDIEEQTLFGWACSANLPAKLEETTYYVKCKDQPWFAGANESKRNVMSESYVMKIKQSASPLKISSVSPKDATLKFKTEPASVEIVVQTEGGLDGTARCSYKIGESYIDFYDTMGKTHKQTFQSLYSGNIELPIVCKDLIGNKAEDTAKFSIEIDAFSPKVSRIYEKDESLIIVTDEDAQCFYRNIKPSRGESGCDYDFANGTAMSDNGKVHSLSFNKAETYYIKCKDQFGNNPGTDCSAIVKGGV